MNPEELNQQVRQLAAHNEEMRGMMNNMSAQIVHQNETMQAQNVKMQFLEEERLLSLIHI